MTKAFTPFTFKSQKEQIEQWRSALCAARYARLVTLRQRHLPKIKEAQAIQELITELNKRIGVLEDAVADSCDKTLPGWRRSKQKKRIVVDLMKAACESTERKRTELEQRRCRCLAAYKDAVQEVEGALTYAFDTAVHNIYTKTGRTYRIDRKGTQLLESGPMPSRYERPPQHERPY